MNRSIISLCLLGVAIWTSGCNTSTSDVADRTNEMGSVAVIDLDEVARRLGRDQQMSDSVQQRADSLNKQITTVRVAFEKQLAAKKTELGDDATDQQKNEVVQLERQMNVKLAQLKQEAETKLNQHRAELVNRFRTETEEAANVVAKAKGITLIVTKNDTVIFSFESALDITDQVVDQFAASTSRIAARPAHHADTK